MEDITETKLFPQLNMEVQPAASMQMPQQIPKPRASPSTLSLADFSFAILYPNPVFLLFPLHIKD